MTIHTVLMLIYVCNKYPVTATYILGLVPNFGNVITIPHLSFNEVAKYFAQRENLLRRMFENSGSTPFKNQVSRNYLTWFE